MILLILLVLSLLAWIWLVVVGFRESTLWGVLATFISPVAAVGLLVVNAKRYWATAVLHLVLLVLLTLSTISFMVGSLGWVAKSDWMQDVYLELCKEASVTGELGISCEQCSSRVSQNWQACKAQVDQLLSGDEAVSGFEAMTVVMGHYSQCLFSSE